MLQWQFLKLLRFLPAPQSGHCQCYWRRERRPSGIQGKRLGSELKVPSQTSWKQVNIEMFPLLLHTAGVSKLIACGLNLAGHQFLHGWYIRLLSYFWIIFWLCWVFSFWCTGFPCFGAWALECLGSVVVACGLLLSPHSGLVIPWHVGS